MHPFAGQGGGRDASTSAAPPQVNRIQLKSTRGGPQSGDERSALMRMSVPPHATAHHTVHRRCTTMRFGLRVTGS